MNSSRAFWIDNLKALGIFLVVAGHSNMHDEARRWLRSFNMPMFLMISGFLISPGGFNVTLREFFMKRVWPFVKLYFQFSLLGMAVYLYIFKNEQELSEMVWGRLRSIAYATGSTDSSWDIFPVVLWYFPCSIMGRLIAYFIWSIHNPVLKTAVFIAAGSLAFLMEGVALPWELESALPAAGFLAIGHVIRLRGIDRKVEKLGAWHWPVTVSLLALGSYFAMKNVNYPDLRSLVVGNGLLAAPAMLLLSAGMPLLAMKLPASRLALAVASATILIFPVHMLIFPYIDRVPEHFGVPIEEMPWYGWGKALVAVCLLTTVHYAYSWGKKKMVVSRVGSRPVASPMLVAGKAA